MSQAAPIRAAVVPCAGSGIRLQPATLAVPKELLPLGAYPALCATLLEVAAAGLSEVVVVVSPDKQPLRRFLDPRSWPPLASAAAQALAQLLSSLRVHIVEQPDPIGALDAIERGVFVCGAPCAVVYPDLVHLPDQRALCQLLAAHDACGEAVYGAYATDRRGPPHGPSAAVVLDDTAGVGARRVRRAGPPSPSTGEWRTTFGYIHTGAMAAQLEACARPTPGGPLSDAGLLPALDALAKEGGLYVVELAGEVLDLGTMAGYLDAQARFGAGRASLRDLP